MATTQNATQHVNIYRNRGQWCYSLWINSAFDHGDTLDAESPMGAEAEVRSLFPNAEVKRVADTNE